MSPFFLEDVFCAVGLIVTLGMNRDKDAALLYFSFITLGFVLEDLYVHELKDLFSAEQQVIKALPKMAKAASSKELAAGFQEHLEQTKGHAQRLEKILSSRKQTTRGPKCKGMEGVIAEGAEMIAEEADVEVKDAGLIAAAQRVEHYEMAGYGTARTYAELLGDKEGAELLALTLEEERQTDQKLSELAKSTVNVPADK
ncbi:MAG TPA: ferritin-like domain-containing protein [Chthoniobacterales bacterium]|jgi:ferritin-like metal-binding protein YciE|nr:ferritin-like domain-containing protein [Chthoniobacterales bacterium]